jgi:hypothetical protein
MARASPTLTPPNGLKPEGRRSHSDRAALAPGRYGLQGQGVQPAAHFGLEYRIKIWCAAHKLRAKTWPTALVQAVERLRLDYPLWGTRRVLIEQQQRRQRPLRLDQIGQCISVQDSEKRLNRIVQHAAQHADALDRAITAPPQTADNIELVLGLAHHLADIDVARRATQADAAPTTAHGIEIAF